MRIIAIIYLFLVTPLLAQFGGKKPVQYRKEKIKYFEFEPFERSFSGVKESMDSLEAKPGYEWDFQDSIQFIVNLAKLGDHSRAYSELKKIRLHDISNENVAHITMIYQLNQRFDLAKLWLGKYKPANKTEIFAKEIWMEMIQLRQDEKDYKRKLKYSDVFITHDKSSYSEEEKEGDEFRENVLAPLEAGEIILEFHIRYVNKDDPYIAKLASQMGDVIHQHLSLTMTYVAYSLARHYNKSSENAKKLKAIKQEIVDSRYEIIPLKKYFPKEKKGRFSYQLLKEKHIESKKKKYQLPPFEKEQEEPLWQSKGFILTLGLLIILIFVLVFIRTKKN